MSIALFAERAKAEPVRERLRQAEIYSEIHEETRLGKFWFVSSRSAGARLEVPGNQFEAAEKLLGSWESSEGELLGVIRCPECRSLRVQYPQIARHSLLTNVTVGLASRLGLVELDFYCEHCHFTWPKAGERPRRTGLHSAPYYFIDGVEQTSRDYAASARPPAKAA